MVTRRFTIQELSNADLVVDAIYEGERLGNSSDDPLHKLIGVSNQGGFRYLGSLDAPLLIVLSSSFSDLDWPDQLDKEMGILTYYGDNKHPGRILHNTPRHGNELLRNMFNALHASPSRKKDIPPILVFANAGSFRDVIFLGLAVPGASELTSLEDLVAIWKIAGNQRFQNYKASLSILDVPCVSRMWLSDIRNRNVFSTNCPAAWKMWVEKGVYKTIRSERTVEYRTKSEQMPDDEHSLCMVQIIYEYFKDCPVLFEKCATEIVKLMDKNFHSFDITRPSRDGGRDAIGLYRIGSGASGISVDLALEAKCYHMDNAVGVREVSRLISRLRHRQFGVLVTTGYLHLQAYQELKEDGHPVIVIAAKDIVQILMGAGISNSTEVLGWLRSNFPK